MAQIKTEPLTDYYEVKEELGRGRFAVVKRCVNLSTGDVYAAKCIRKARAGRRGREQLLLEIDILHNSDHPKLVKLYDVFETRSEIILILEYAAGGDLHKHCLEVEAVRTEKEICFLIYQIVEAALYLHENHVVHLDLKPENILLKNDTKFPEIRLIDFGLSRRVDLPYSQYDIVGTPEYVAPEVLSYEPIKISADMWSIGVVSYVLLSGISPFAGDDVMETYANIANVDFDFDAEEFDDISDEAKDFIESLLIKDPSERLTTKECLEHPWLQQMAGGVQRKDIEAAFIAEEAFEKFIRAGSISRLESENSCFSSETDTLGDGEQAVSSDDLSDMTTDDGDSKDTAVFLEETLAGEEKLASGVSTSDDDDKASAVKQEEEVAAQSLADDVASNDQSVEVDEKEHSNVLKEEDDQMVEDSTSRSVKAGEPSQSVAKVSFPGGFDIDSLICKDDENTEDVVNEVNATSEKQNSLSFQGDINANVEVMEEKENDIELSKDSEFNLTEVESKPLEDGSSSKISSIDNELSLEYNVKKYSKLSRDSEVNLTEVESKSLEDESSSKMSSIDSELALECNVKKYSKVGVDLQKQVSSDAVLTSRQLSTTLNNYTRKETDDKTLLNRARSVDDNLLSRRKKVGEVSKGSKLGAHLEKLTKAGLSIKDEPDGAPHAVPLSINGGAGKKDQSEKGSSDKEKKERLCSSMSWGSDSSTSDKATPDLNSISCVDEVIEVEKNLVTNSPRITAKLGEERRASEGLVKVQNDPGKPLLNGKGTPVSTRKVATPSSERSLYPKKQSLGVPQGIAAQMASKFSSNTNKTSTPSPAKPSKMTSQSVISNRKYFQGTTPDAPVIKSKRSSLKMDKTLFSNAIKVAKGEASQDQTVQLEHKSKSPKNSPKLNRSKNACDVHLKDKAEQYIKVAADPDHGSKGQVSSPKTEKKIMQKPNRPESDAIVEKNLKTASTKENIVQKFEKQSRQDHSGTTNKVNVQPKGLQFSFSLQAGNKFRIKDASTEKESLDAGTGKMASNGNREGKKTVTFDARGEKSSRRKVEPVTIPKSFSGILGEDEAHATQGDEHIEHTAIGALATMPRTPLRDLRSKSRTSRDGGSPSSPRKAYRRLYVTHVKGSKSEQENEMSEDIADIKTKIEKDELQVELLVKFGTL